MKIAIPSTIKPLLWDIKSEEGIDIRYSSFVIERVLELGDVKQYNWLKKEFSEKEIVNTLKSSKRISAKSANYFSLVYKIPKDAIQCLAKPYTQKQNRF
jgi:hypothetical protein